MNNHGPVTDHGAVTDRGRATPDEPAAVAEDPGALSVDVRRGSPSDVELAAAIAVITEAYSREAADAVAEDETRDAWSLAARGLRQPLRRDLGWRGYAG